MTKNKYIPTAIGLYMNYFVHGMGVLILALNRESLISQWNTDIKGVSSVIAMIGIGRLVAILISGYLSDKFGRKPFVYLGMATYCVFFLGILFSPSVTVACVFAVIAGIANSFLDSGTYPALMESFPKAAGTANVLIKAFIQVGQFLLPFMVSFLISAKIWYGWSFVFCVVVFVINAIYLANKKFPDSDAAEASEEGKQAAIVTRFKSQPKMYLEGICFVAYGFISQATFYLISNYIGLYGEKVAGMSANNSNLLVSYYSIGALACVGVTSIVATKIRPINLVLPYTLVSFLTISAMWLMPSPIVLTVGAVLVGFFAAGGVMQLGLTVMGEMFPSGKGTITGIFYTFGSIASFVIPNVAGKIAASDKVQNIMLFDTIIAGIGFVLALIIFIRYYQTVETSPEIKAEN